jgi:hypothetical protein
MESTPSSVVVLGPGTRISPACRRESARTPQPTGGARWGAWREARPAVPPRREE